MTFSISNFVRVNRVYLIWLVFAALLYLFRDMFGLVFITYIMCFITSSITHALRRRFRWSRRFIIVAVYAIFLALVTAFLALMPPRLLNEAISFTEQIPHSVQAIRTWIDANLGSNEMIAPLLAQAKNIVTPETAVINGWNIARAALGKRPALFQLVLHCHAVQLSHHAGPPSPLSGRSSAAFHPSFRGLPRNGRQHSPFR